MRSKFNYFYNKVYSNIIKEIYILKFFFIKFDNNWKKFIYNWNKL